LNKNSLLIGRIFGIPIRVDYSWFLIFALFTWSFATSYYPTAYANWPAVEYWIVGAITALMLFVSVLLHEIGHSWVSQRYKIPVRDITLYIFGGISQISSEPTSAWTEFWISIAGPLVSFILAGLFALLRLVVTGVAPVLALFTYLSYINLVLGAFNLIPGFPLDGGGVLMAIVWGISRNRHRALLVASFVGNIFAYLFIFYGVLLAFNGNFINGLWIAFIGWFLLNASTGQVRQERLKELLGEHKVSEAINRNYAIIHSETTLQYLVDNHILGESRRSFVVEKMGIVVGLLTLHNLRSTPREKWATTTVDQVMIPTDQFKQIDMETCIWDAIQEMDRDGVNQLPVMEAGQIQGMFSREDVINLLRSLVEKPQS
jgi:Zn-dependent protease/CBS domain-containing protein